MDVAQRIRSRIDAVSDRLGITPWSFAAGLAAVAVAGVGGWWALRAPAPPPVEEVLPRIDVVGALAPPAAETFEDDPPGDEVIVVHVDGAVGQPGVHELEPGSRVVDAVAAAQGLRDDADRSRLNLAAPISDGQRVWVPVVGEEEPTVVAVTGGGPDDGGGGHDPAARAGPIDLNSATAAELETLPGIGPGIAAAIVGHREDNGRFGRVEDLLEVPGIGPARLAQLEPLVAV